MSDSGYNEDSFYKGLFFGALLGIGIVWFMGTKEGKKVKKQLRDKGEEFIGKAKESVDTALVDDFIESDKVQPEEGEQPESAPKRFFEEK